MAIDFARINQDALSRYPDLLSQWLPGGKTQGREFVVGDLSGAPGRSLSVNLDSGVWRDFAGDDAGSDPVSLYAAIKGLSQADAAHALAKELGIEAGGNGAGQHRKQEKKPEWSPILPVPPDAPAPDFEHFRLKKPVAVWRYNDEQGRALGYVARFERPDGGKEILPLVFAENATGGRQWRWLSFPKPRSLFGLDLLAASPKAGVLIVEGEKACDAANRLLQGKNIVAATWPGGSKATKYADFSPLRGRRVAIWPDHDEPGRQAAEAVAAMCREVGAENVVAVTPPEDAPESWDLADGEAEGWTGERVLEWIKTHKCGAEAKEDQPLKTAKKRTPSPQGFPFVVKTDGVYFLTEDRNGDITSEWVCSPLHVAALARDDDGGNWGRLLRLEDPDGAIKTWAMPMAMLAGSGDELRATLLSMGLRIAPGQGKQRLSLYLSLANPTDRARCVARIGWHGFKYLLPDAIYGQGDGEQTVLQGATSENLFKVSGTLEDWQGTIGRWCVGNSRLAFAVSGALAAPLLHPLGVESGGFHFVGGSSCGKTTALAAAGSTHGGGGLHGFLRTWRATDNGLESIAAQHCDALLCLDEMGQVAGKTAGEVAYMLANGQGKSRARRDGTGKAPFEWRVLFLSTGEGTLADKAREDGRSKIKAGQAVRIVDIPADAGVGLGLFEELHGHENGHLFSRAIRDAARSCYGTPLRVFLETITIQLDEITKTATVFMRDFVGESCPAHADGQVKRVCQRFALVAAAGEIATATGILPWPDGEATAAAKRCFQDWLAQRGGVGAGEIQAGIEQVRAFFAAHGSSRFELWDSKDDNAKIVNRAGFKKLDELGRWEFFVFPEVFKNEVAAGFNAKLLVADLRGRGWLTPGTDGKSAASMRLPGIGKTRVYHFTSQVMEDEDV